jgi:hypothetical protein
LLHVTVFRETVPSINEPAADSGSRADSPQALVVNGPPRDSGSKHADNAQYRAATQRVAARVVTAVGIVAVIAGCGSVSASRMLSLSNASSKFTYADYPTLARRAPSGITVIMPSQVAAAETTSARPIWIAVKPRHPQDTIPEIATARKAQDLGTARLWIARSDHEGICLLIYVPAFSPEPARDHQIFSACGTFDPAPIFLVAEGAKTFIAGLVPSRVSTVSIRLANGQHINQPVRNESYATSLSGEIKGVSFVRDGVTHYTNTSNGGNAK